jgi:glycosyltransferase involved in cell wall biosynthesis
MSLDIGGTEKHLSLIAPALRERGWKPVIFCLWRRGHLAKALEDSGVEVIGRLDKDERWLGSGRTLSLAMSSLRLMAFAVRQKPKIIHFYLPLAYLLGAPIAILARIPVMVMSRRSLNLYQRKHSAIRRIEHWLHRRMTAILANSRRVAHELIEQEGCPPEKVGLIYNGTDLSTISAAKRSDASTLGVPAGELTMIMVANLIPYKGHADLLNALGEIAPKLPQPWHLVCVGRDQGCGPQLRDQVARLGLEKNIHFLGERSDVPQLLKTANIGILSSHEEGFSNAVIEGLAAALPMIVTDVGGNAEAVQDGITGIVVPPRNPAALAHAILKLASNPDLRTTMGIAARACAEREFTLESCVEKYDSLYRGLLNGQNPDKINAIAFDGKTS